MSSYLELCVKFRKLVGISGSGPSAVTGQSGMNEKITIWVADADEWVQRRWEDWSFMLEPKVVISATAASSTFTLATLGITNLARWRKSTFVRDPGTSDMTKLDYSMSYTDYLKSDEYLGEEQTGEIEKVIIRTTDDAVIFYPTPEATTTVWAAYYKKVTRLSANGSVSPIPVRFEDIILNRAKMYYAEHLEDVSLYQIAEKAMTDDLFRLESKYAPSFDGVFMSNNDVHEDIMVM